MTTTSPRLKVGFHIPNCSPYSIASGELTRRSNNTTSEKRLESGLNVGCACRSPASKPLIRSHTEYITTRLHTTSANILNCADLGDE